MKLNRAEKEMLENIRTMDGLEVHEWDWHTAESLEAKGLVDLSPARGPKGKWKRVTERQG